MKAIIVIKGVLVKEYLQIREDLTNQIRDLGWDIPLFACLPSEFAEIEIVWVDEKMEQQKYSEVVNNYSLVNRTNENT